MNGQQSWLQLLEMKHVTWTVSSVRKKNIVRGQCTIDEEVRDGDDEDRDQGNGGSTRSMLDKSYFDINSTSLTFAPGKGKRPISMNYLQNTFVFQQ